MARSRRAQLQRIAGDQGTVQPFAAVADLEHRAIGWYLSPAAAHPGCACVYCVAATAGTATFLAGGAFLAATLLQDYVTTHAALTAAPS